MNEQVQQALRDLVTEHGAGVATDGERCEALLRERCPANKREVALLLGVLRSGVMGELQRLAAGSEATGRVGMLARRVEDELGVKADAARWAVEGWVLALGPPPEAAKPVAPAAPLAPAPAPRPAPAPVPAPAPPVAPVPAPRPAQALPPAAPVPAPPPAVHEPEPVPVAAPSPEPVPLPVAAPASAPRRVNPAWIAAAVVAAAVALYVLWRVLQR